MSNADRKLEHAQSLGIPVQDVAESYAKHMLEQRRKLRDNPRLADASKPPERYDLAVTQDSAATGTRWRTLGELPHGIGEISVTASTWEAAKNKQSLRSLLEQRYRREFASALQRAGLYQTDLEGRRAAMKVALESPVTVVDVALAGLA